MQKDLLVFRLTIFVFLLSPLLGKGQDFSKYSMIGGTGLGTGTYTGWGPRVVVGYQKNMDTGKARIAPRLSFGRYSTSGIEDARVIDYSTLGIGYDVQIDLIKINYVSVVLGTGFSYLRSSGVKEAYAVTGASSETFAHNSLGVDLQFGFRLAPDRRRVSYELLLLDGTVGKERREASTLNLRICVQLNKK